MYGTATASLQVLVDQLKKGRIRYLGTLRNKLAGLYLGLVVSVLGTQTEAGLFRTDQPAGVALPLQPKNRGSLLGNFGTLNRVDCLSD